MGHQHQQQQHKQVLMCMLMIVVQEVRKKAKTLILRTVHPLGQQQQQVWKWMLM
jgi:hypothetical protein